MLRTQKATNAQQLVYKFNRKTAKSEYKLQTHKKEMVYLQFVTKLEHLFRFLGKKMDK